MFKLDLDLELDRPQVLQLLDTLATLPLLRNVHLFVKLGIPHQICINSLIKASPAVNVLTIEMRDSRGWTWERRERVQAAGREAGVTFKYAETSF